MSSYPAFDPPPSYPRPSHDNINLNLPFPTNSWFQEGLVDNIADVDRLAAGTPWYVKPVYSQNLVGLYFNSIGPVTTAHHYGNIILQEAPRNQLNISIEDAETLTTTEVTDLSVELTYKEGNNTTGKCSYARGSPLVNFEMNNSSLILESLSGLTSLEEAPNSGVENKIFYLTSKVSVSSTLSDNLIPAETEKLYVSNKDTKFYKFVSPIPETDVSISYGIKEGQNRGSTVDIEFTLEDGNKEFLFSMPSNNPSNADVSIPDGYTHKFLISDEQIGVVVTEEGLDGDVFIVSVNIKSRAITVEKTVQTAVRWLIYTNSLLIFNQGASTVRSIPSSGTNYFRIGYGGTITDGMIDFFGQQFSLDNTIVSDAFKENVVDRGEIKLNSYSQEITNDVDPNGDIVELVSWSYVWSYNGGGTIFLPPHLASDDFEVSGIALHDSALEIESIAYGKVKLYSIITYEITIKTKPIHIDLFQNIANILNTPDSQASMGNLLELDILHSIDQLTFTKEGEETVIRKDLNPYNFGLIIAKASRVLNLAIESQNKPGIETDPILINILLGVIRGNLISWLDGTNNSPGTNAFQLQREGIWGGIIVPADSQNITDKTAPTSYGNSFYNDHHFHYGYIVYALATLEKLDVGLFTDYPNNIMDLVNDYSNPTNNMFPHLRHKDLFYGHSWATGVPGLKTNIPGLTGAGPVNRQQESVGEAINGYFSAYLLGKELRNENLQIHAGMAMYLEIIASRFYYFYQNEGSDLGDLSNTGTIGIIQTAGKSYTLNFETQPATFPGRILGINGIQAIPFTEISGNYLTDDLTYPFNPSSEYVKRMDEFGLTQDLVGDVLSGSYVPVPMEKFQNPLILNTYVQEDGYYWGNVGLEVLGFDASTTPTNVIQRLFSFIARNALENPTDVNLKDFDSLSNTYYILLRLRGDFNISTCCMKAYDNIKDTILRLSEYTKNKNKNIKYEYSRYNIKNKKGNNVINKNRPNECKNNKLNSCVHGSRGIEVKAIIAAPNQIIHRKTCKHSQGNNNGKPIGDDQVIRDYRGDYHIESDYTSSGESRITIDSKRHTYTYKNKEFIGELLTYNGDKQIKGKCEMCKCLQIKILYSGNNKKHYINKDKIKLCLMMDEPNITKYVKYILIYTANTIKPIEDKKLKSIMKQKEYIKYINHNM